MCMDAHGGLNIRFWVEVNRETESSEKIIQYIILLIWRQLSSNLVLVLRSDRARQYLYGTGGVALPPLTPANIVFLAGNQLYEL